ncbi:hypothetical protein [Paenibacillus massiliensis]|uniref:hypothetical protein n=1 Tax=Paenibacillus massiliensis TaxID=225917 RepID=UPI00040CBB8D|nr:hypothetical protein [Paenibacillus massiliensis]
MNELFRQWHNRAITPEYYEFLRELNEEEALEGREEPEFDQQWVAEFERLEKSREQLSEQELAAIHSLREQAFKQSYRVMSSPDVSAYISDDLELIAMSLLLGETSSWALQTLKLSYDEGQFPPQEI